MTFRFSRFTMFIGYPDIVTDQMNTLLYAYFLLEHPVLCRCHNDIGIDRFQFLLFSDLQRIIHQTVDDSGVSLRISCYSR